MYPVQQILMQQPDVARMLLHQELMISELTRVDLRQEDVRVFGNLGCKNPAGLIY